MKTLSIASKSLLALIFFGTMSTAQDIYQPQDGDLLTWKKESEFSSPREFTNYFQRVIHTHGNEKTEVSRATVPPNKTIDVTNEYGLRYESNYCLEYAARFVSGSSVLGFTWGSDGGSNADVFEINAAGTYQYFREQNGKTTVVLPPKAAAIKYKDWNVFRLLKSGSDMIFYLNGTEVARRTHEEPLHSRIGFRIRSASVETNIEIDYLRVYERDPIDSNAVKTALSKAPGDLIQRNPSRQTATVKSKMTLSVQSGHAIATDAFLSPDGKLLASNEYAMQTGQCKLWDLNTGMEIRALSGYGQSFSKDGQRLLLLDLTEARIVSVKTGELIFKLPNTYSVVSPDGEWMVALVPPVGWTPKEDHDEPPTSACVIYNLKTGAQTNILGQTANLGRPQITPDGKNFFMVVGSKTHFWGLPWGTKLGTVETALLHPQQFSKDHQYMMARITDTSYAYVSLSSFKILNQIHVGRGKVGAQMSPDGKLFIMRDNKSDRILLWHTQTGVPNNSFTAVMSNVNALFSDDSQFLFTTERINQRNEALHRIIKWEVSTGRQVSTIETGVFSPYELKVYDSLLYVYYLDNKLELFHISTMQSLFSAPGDVVNGVFIDERHGMVIVTSKGSVLVLSLKEMKLIREFTPKIQVVSAVQFDPTNQFLYLSSQTGSSRKLDLASAKISTSYPVWNLNMDKNGNILSGIATGVWQYKRDTKIIRHTLSFFDARGGRRFYSVSNGGYGIPEPHALSYKGDYFAQTTNTPHGIIVHRTHSGTPVWKFPITRDVDLLTFSKTSDRLLVGDRDTLHLLDITTSKKIWAVKQKHFFFLEFSPDGKTLAIDDNFDLVLMNAESGRILHHLKGHLWNVKDAAFSPDGSRIVSVSQDLTVRLWNTSNGQLIKTIKPFTNYITSVDWSPDGNMIAACALDGKTILFDARTLDPIATVVLIDDNFVIYTPDNYYAASKGAGKGVGFAVEDQAFPFDQFDLKFNRPDIVVDRIGYGRKEIIDAYKFAYKKRLSKMNFTETMLGDDAHLPTLKITNSDLPLTTRQKTLTFKVSAADTWFLLDRIMVFVNDVPVFGSQGIDLRSRKVNMATEVIELPLSLGINKVQVSSLNQRGAESIRQIFSVTLEGEAVKPNLYVLAIGVSDYTDNAYDLTYAAKDAMDLTSGFKNASAYAQVHTITLVDKEATKKNILSAREFLMQSKIDDQVVVFVAGHGLLDDKLDYYFATTDVDFNNPAEGGLLYEELEKLVDGIPARKRLILMDACHSGEVDKEETELIASTLGTESVKSRGFKKAQKKTSMGLQNSFELMKELFADLRRGSGAMVISSASGVEFAFESPEWKNGVFTYSLLEGLRTQSADKNKDGQVIVSELRDYVIEKVKKLTGGKQTPTSRQENLEFDFRVY